MSLTNFYTQVLSGSNVVQHTFIDDELATKHADFEIAEW